MSVVLMVTAAAIGVVLGRLYSFLAVLLVSPLMGLVGTLAALSLGRAVGGACLAGLVCVVLLDGAYLAGVGLRLWSVQRSSQRRRTTDAAAFVRPEKTISSP